jgi:N-acetylglucosamine-6-phosphate deacetylase
MTPNRHAVVAHRVFDGLKIREDAAVVIEGSQIVAVVSRTDISARTPIRTLSDDLLLAPGFIDIQVNGGGDVLFNDDPTPPTIRTIVAAHRKFGTTSLLPTLISDSPSKMAAAISSIESLIDIEPSVLGIHLEGPFLSPDKAGVHDPDAIRQPTIDDLALISRPRRCATLVTLAPEQVPPEFIAKLAAAGVRVALGHSMATYAQTCVAISRGLTGFTHLFNAMRPLESREPGPIAAALENPNVWYSLIVDNVHVAPAMVRLALRGNGHPILVTDAMPPVGGVSSTFMLHGENVGLHEDRCTTDEGRLAGAYLDMATSVRNCLQTLNVSLTDALRFASVHPAEFIGRGDTLGKIAPGFRADMIALDGSTIEVIETWVAGIPAGA